MMADKGPVVLELSREDERDSAQPQTFYRYEAKGGKIVIVDSLSKLPPEARDLAERVELGPAKSAVGATSAVATTPSTVTLPVVTEPKSEQAGSAHVAAAAAPTAPEHVAFALEWPSFGIGLGTGLLLALAAAFLSGRSSGGMQRWVLRAVVFASVVLLGSSVYLGWARGRAGLGDSVLASPNDLMKDARGAVEQVQQRRAEQERELEELKRLAK